MERLRQTPSQTVGPFFAYGLTAEQYGYRYDSIVHGSLVGEEVSGRRIYITGNVFDGNGATIPDAMLELSQVDETGRYRLIPVERSDEDFIGFGRLGTGTDSKHRFRFTTVKPASFNLYAPHINIILFMRGSLRHLYTRLYFSDEKNEHDVLLNSVDPARRQTLIAQRREVNGEIEYHFDIHMQGEKETVFFDL